MSVGNVLAVVTLPDATLQVFCSNLTLWQTSTGAWSDTSAFLPPQDDAGTEPNSWDTLAVCNNKDGIAQVWGSYLNLIATELNVVTRAKTSLASGAPWTGWGKFPRIPPTQIGDLCAALSASGEVQVFAQTNDTIVTCWERGANEETAYFGWDAFGTAPPYVGAGPRAVTLPDGRLQLWAATLEEQLITCEKESTHPGAAWTAWSSPMGDSIWSVDGRLGLDGNVHLWQVQADTWQVLTAAFPPTPPPTSINTWTPVALPAGTMDVRNLAVATLADGRLQIFVVTWNDTIPQQTFLYTQYQISGDNFASWSEWQQIAVLS